MPVGVIPDGEHALHVDAGRGAVELLRARRGEPSDDTDTVVEQQWVERSRRANQHGVDITR